MLLFVHRHIKDSILEYIVSSLVSSLVPDPLLFTTPTRQCHPQRNVRHLYIFLFHVPWSLTRYNFTAPAAPYGQVQSQRKLELTTLEGFKGFLLRSRDHPLLPTTKIFVVNFADAPSNWYLSENDCAMFALSLSRMVRLRALRVYVPALHDVVIAALCQHPAPRLQELRITFGPILNPTHLAAHPIELQTGSLRWVYLLEFDVNRGQKFEYPMRYVEMVAGLLACSADTIELLSIRGPLNVKQIFTRTTQSLDFPRLEVLKVWENIIRESPCFAKVTRSVKALELWSDSGTFLTDPERLQSLGLWFPALVKLDLTTCDRRLPDVSLYDSIAHITAESNGHGKFQASMLNALGVNLIKRNLIQISLALELAFGGPGMNTSLPPLEARQEVWRKAVDKWVVGCPALKDVTFQSGLCGLTRWTYEHGVIISSQPDKRMSPDTDYALTAEDPSLYYETHEKWTR